MIPDDLLYAKSHEWARISDQEALVGITNFAQQQLGDITFVELTAVGDIVTEGHEMGSIESVKAASELISPVSGTVLHVNTEVRVHLSSQPQNLLSPQQYAEIAEGQE